MKLSEQRARSAQLALAIAFFIQGFLLITFVPRIPELIDQINVSFAIWGLIIGLAGVGSLLALLITNRIIGRFGTRPVVRASVILMALSIMSLGFAPNAWLYLIAHSSMMLSVSFFNIAVNSQAVMLQKKVKKVIIGKLHASWSIGAASSAAVSGILASLISIQLHLVIVPLLALVAFEFSIRLMLSPEEDGHNEEKQASKKISFFRSPKQLWILAAGFFAGVFPEMIMMDWATVFAKQVMLLNPTLGAIPFASFMLAMIAGRLLISRATTKFHISELSQWGGIFGSIAMLLGVILAPPLVSQNQLLGLLVISILWGLSGFGLAPMVPSFFSAAGYVSGLTTAQALSRISLVNAIVLIVAKIAMGGLAQGVGLEIAFLFPVALMFIAGVIAGSVAKQAKRKEAMENAFPMTGPLAVVDEL